MDVSTIKQLIKHDGKSPQIHNRIEYQLYRQNYTTNAYPAFNASYWHIYLVADNVCYCIDMGIKMVVAFNSDIIVIVDCNTTEDAQRHSCQAYHASSAPDMEDVVKYQTYR